MKQTCSHNLTRLLQSRNVCSANLTKHLKLLKKERNRLLTLQDNGYKISVKEFNDYLEHKKYVTELLHDEKVAYYNKILIKSSKKTLDK